MKKVLIYLLVITFSTNTFSQEPTLLEDVLREMSRQYVMERIKEEAHKELEKRAGQAIANEISSDVTNAMAVIGLITSAQNYEKADTETARYQAFMQGVANAATLVDPAIGSAIQLAVMTQGLAAAIVSKKYSLEVMQLMAQIAQTERKTSEMIKTEFEAEVHMFESLIGRSVAIAKLIKKNSDAVSTHCLAEQVTTENGQKCIKAVFLQLKLTRSQEQTVLRLITFSGRFISVAKLQQIKMDTLQNELNIAIEHINFLHKTINEKILIFIEKSISEIKESSLKRAYFYRCERLITGTLKKIIVTKKSILEETDNEGFDQLLLPTYKEDLQELTKVTCAEVFQSLDPHIQRLTKTYLEELDPRQIR